METYGDVGPAVRNTYPEHELALSVRGVHVSATARVAVLCLPVTLEI